MSTIVLTKFQMADNVIFNDDFILNLLLYRKRSDNKKEDKKAVGLFFYLYNF